MRRRRKNKNYFVLNIIIILLLVFTTIGISYSYVSSSLSIKGTAKGIYVDEGYTITPDSNPNLTANVSTTNCWIESGLNRCQFRLNITNIGQTTLDNFKITVTFRKNIESPTMWDYAFTSGNRTLTIINNKYDINPGQTISIDFAVSSKFSPISILSLKLEATNTIFEVPLASLPVSFARTGSWGTYNYQYNVTVTNKTGNKITYWQLNIELPVGTTYVSGWNGIFTVQNNTLTVKSESYNGKLNNNASATFGLQLFTNISNYIPNNIRTFVR